MPLSLKIRFVKQSLPMLPVMNQWGVWKTTLNRTMHTIVILALLTVLNEAALCGIMIL